MVNAPEFFLSHRLPLAEAARDKGYEVHVACALGPDVESISKRGFTYHKMPFTRSGQNPIRELGTAIRLFRLMYDLKPNLVHLITIKPVLYGGLVARFTGVGAVVAAVSGLGTVFIAKSLPSRLRRWLVVRMYRAAFRQNRLAVIFQNPDDRDALLSLGVLKASEVRMIRGSGVCLDAYPFELEPGGRPVIAMVARLLRDKGVFEFVEAARLLRERGVDVDMRLVGSPDPGNPSSVTQQDLQQWEQDGIVTLLGFRTDIAAQYAAANVVCLPSYREGLPKSLVEAAACGRAVVTTDVPGCRDAITPGVTGLLVPAKNAWALADAIQQLIEDEALRKAMGKAGRVLAEKAFAIERVVDQHMAIYAGFLPDENGSLCSGEL